MKISSIMTRRVVTVEMDDSLQIIREIFENVKFHHIMVVDGQKLAGVISDRDLIDREERYTITLDKNAHEIMSRNLIL